MGCVRASRQVKACTCALTLGLACCLTAAPHVAPGGRAWPLSKDSSCSEENELRHQAARASAGLASRGLSSRERGPCVLPVGAAVWVVHTHGLPGSVKATPAPRNELPLVHSANAPLRQHWKGKDNMEKQTPFHPPYVSKKLSGPSSELHEACVVKDPVINPPATIWRLSRHLHPDHRLLPLGFLSSSEVSK